MSKITLNPALKALLNSLDEQLEICDDSGTVLGRFLPEAAYRKMIYALAEAQRPPLPVEEVERRRKETGGKPLAEIWKQLAQS